MATHYVPSHYIPEVERALSIPHRNLWFRPDLFICILSFLSGISIHEPLCNIVINLPQIIPIHHQNRCHSHLYQQPTGRLKAVQWDKRSDSI